MRRMAERCTSCGDCVRPCRFLQQRGTPAVIAGAGAASPNLLKAYDCSLCGLCDALCPEGLSPSAMFLAMRQQAAAAGAVDLRPYKPWLTYERLGGSFLFRRDYMPADCRTVFFPGCALPGTRPEIVKELFRRLRQQEPSMGLVLDCCGKISHDLGLQERFGAISRSLQRRLRKQGVTRVLTACPGCSKIFRSYGQDFEVRSVYERLVTEPMVQPVAPRGVVSIHDPCPSRFDPAQHLAVRRLAEQCGYQVEELAAHGRITRCCGQGGMVEACVPGAIRQEATVIGADASGRPLISSCAACCDTLSSVTPAAHVADLLAGDAEYFIKPKSALQRWVSRFQLRWAKLT